MDKIFFEIKNQLYETAQLVVEFCKTINPYVAGAVVLALYLLVFRRWMFRKILSFCLTIFLLFVLFVRIDNILLTNFGQDPSSFSVGVFRTVSIIIAGIILLYYAAVKQ
jgi:Na+-transporting NADH:ubiquinone oxidoreductase subunit NqrB